MKKPTTNGSPATGGGASKHSSKHSSKPIDADALREAAGERGALDVLRALGVEVQTGSRNGDDLSGLKLPPAFGSDAKGSVSINLRSWLVNDFGGKFSGTLYQLVQQSLRLDFPAAVAWVATTTGADPEPDEPKRLSLADLAKAKGFDVATLTTYGAEDVPRAGCIRIRYKLADGTDARTRMRWAKGSGKPKNTWLSKEKKLPIVPYGLHRPADVAEPFADDVLVIVEGETDTWACWDAGARALGIPGATLTKKLDAKHLSGAKRIVVLIEPDDGGAAFQTNMKARLDALAFDGEAFMVHMKGATAELPGGPFKDACDLRAADPEAFADRLATTIAEAVPLCVPEPEDEPAKVWGSEPTALDVLDDVAAECKLFVSESGTAHVRAPRPQGGFETYEIRSGDFDQWLRVAYYGKAKAEGYRRMAPTGEALETCLATLCARARFEPDFAGPQKVFIRTAGTKNADGFLDAIYYDLANKAGDVVKVTADGWEIVQEPPEGVHLIRIDGQLPTPKPDADGTLADALPLLHAETPAEQTFILSWLVFAFHPFGDYPLLALLGRSGSGKSKLTEWLVELTDNRETKKSRWSSGEENLFIHALNNHVCAFENVRRITKTQSDGLCSILTGSGFTKRKLYTNTGESRMNVIRPAVLNGITNVVHEEDLKTRLLRVNLRSLSGEDRLLNAEIVNLRESLTPKVLGGVFSALVEALKRPGHRSPTVPRLSDFVSFIDAARDAFPPELPALYDAMLDLQTTIAEEIVEANGVATAVIYAAENAEGGILEGDLKSWWQKFKPYREDEQLWPETVRAFQEDLRRLEATLREYGVSIERALNPDGTPRKDAVTRRALYRLSYEAPDKDICVSLPQTALTPLDERYDPSDPSDPSKAPLYRLGDAKKAYSKLKGHRRVAEGSKGDPSEPKLLQRPGIGSAAPVNTGHHIVTKGKAPDPSPDPSGDPSEEKRGLSSEYTDAPDVSPRYEGSVASEGSQSAFSLGVGRGSGFESETDRSQTNGKVRDRMCAPPHSDPFGEPDSFRPLPSTPAP